MNAFFKLVLKGSAIGALSLVAVAAGCSDSSDDNKGDDAAGGDNSTTGGKNNTGGSNSNAGKDGAQAGDTSTPQGGDTSTMGGATSTMGGDNGVITMGGDKGTGGDLIGAGGAGLGFGGQKGTGTGPSVAKFCNTLSFGAADTTMILEIGEGADKVTFTATTGECVPADGDACTEIPQGDAVSISMFDMDDPSTALDTISIGVGAGEQLIFWTDLGGPDNDPFPIISGTSLDAAEQLCKDVTYDQIP
jgi:hypothetical protein